MGKPAPFGLKKDGRPKKKPGRKPGKKHPASNRVKMPQKHIVEPTESKIEEINSGNTPGPDPDVKIIGFNPPESARSPFADSPLPPPAQRGGVRLVNEPPPEPEKEEESEEETPPEVEPDENGRKPIGEDQAALYVDIIFQGRDNLAPVPYGWFTRLNQFPPVLRAQLVEMIKYSEGDKAVLRPLLIPQLAKL